MIAPRREQAGGQRAITNDFHVVESLTCSSSAMPNRRFQFAVNRPCRIVRRHMALPIATHVAEDDPAVGRLLVTLLSAFGPVLLATSGAEATHIASTAHVDLLIADVGLPDIRGVELVRQVRTVHPDVRVLLISGYLGEHGCAFLETVFRRRPAWANRATACPRRAIAKDRRPERYRRPRYLFSGLTVCGACGSSYALYSHNRLACTSSRERGTCTNRATIAREEVESACSTQSGTS
jgi:CheY-like chemotaxis protein